MPVASGGNKPGLGTNIVEALAKRMDAKVQVTSASQGTEVSIIRAQIAAVPGARNV